MSSTTSETLSPVSETPSPNQKNYLWISRRMDFWLIGGASMLLWIPIYFLGKDFEVIYALGLAIPSLAFFLAYLINYPHFMASYKLAYTQSNHFIVSNWFQLIFVPIFLILLMANSLIYWDSPIKDATFILTINSLFETIGLDTRFGQYPNLGSQVMGLMINLMYFTVGWHYSKQTFGCMMVYAKFDNYRLNNLERNVLRYALLSTWWVSWLSSNCSKGTYNFYDLEIYRLNLPYFLFEASVIICIGLFCWFFIIISLKYMRTKTPPSLNFLIPIFALWTWHIPLFGNPQFFPIIALFHSLQYFPFVAKVESTRYRLSQNIKPLKRMGLFFSIMVILGFLSFTYVPDMLDGLGSTTTTLGVSFFLIAFSAFINIHHYFIDNVLWRFNNKEVRELLFG